MWVGVRPGPSYIFCETYKIWLMNFLTVIKKSVSSGEKVGSSEVFVRVETKSNRTVKRDAPTGGNISTVTASKRRVDEVFSFCLQDLWINVQILVNAPEKKIEGKINILTKVSFVNVEPLKQLEETVIKKKWKMFQSGV